MAKILMVQGTSSSAGKSSLAAALCRIFSDDGYRVAPLKAQNMSSNIFITNEGEMAKAQAIQAIASRTEPSVYMNPILLKPMGDYVSKVFILGKPYREMHAREYYTKFVMKEGMKHVMKAVRKLSSHDLIVIEGAGSPAETNLEKYDLANMKLAEALHAPVFIIADIERGGCFASMLGTIQLLKRKHRSLVKGFIINKFRGDRSILDDAIDEFEGRAGKPVLGIIPFIDSMLLPSEDSLGVPAGSIENDKVNVAVVKYPGAANVSDFDSLLQASGALNTYYVTGRRNILPDTDLILLPSSRDITTDMQWLQDNGIADRISALRGNAVIIGIREGYAMMGKKIVLDGERIDGLGILDATFHAGTDRKAGRIRARTAGDNEIVPRTGTVEGHFLNGYKVVNGKNAVPLLHVHSLNGRNVTFKEGLVSSDSHALGSCVYGLFDVPSIRNGVIGFLLRRKGISADVHNLGAMEFWDRQIQQFSNIVRTSIDMDRIKKLAGLD